MMQFITLILGFITLALFMLYIKSRRPSQLPPGPPTIPFIGNLNSLDQKNIIKSFRNYAQTYGDVFSLILGTRTVVVINRLDTLKEFFVKNSAVTSDRPDVFIFQEISEKMGIGGSSGHTWKTQRTFTLNALREFGFGKRSLESKISEELGVLLTCIREEEGRPFDPCNLLHVSISNVLCSILFGKRYEYTDKRFVGLLQKLKENLSNSAVIGLMSFLPFIRYIPGDPFKIRCALKNVEAVEDYLREIIREHKQNYEEGETRDLVDLYIKKINEDKANGITNSEFNEKQMLKVIGDIFGAGSESTASSIRWFILFSIRHPDVQEKMRTEIRNVIGESRLPKMEDRQNLPYCEAVIAETLRVGNIAPFAIPHGLTQDLEFRGYTIPKDTLIFPNLDSSLFDPEVFPEPEEFRPSRFLDNDGKFTGQEKMIPFSLGRRVCLGESLARMELYLYITSIIQRFKLLPESDGDIPGLESDFGIAHAPKPYRFRAVEI